MPKARSLRRRPRQATRPPPRQARSKDLYESILDATLQVLMARGWKTLTTTRVALRAGVSIGSLYRYFPTREALIRSVLEREVRREATRVDGFAQRIATENPFEVLRTMIVDMCSRFAAQGVLFTRLIQLADRLDLQAALESMRNTSYEKLGSAFLSRKEWLVTHTPELTWFFVHEAARTMFVQASTFKPELLTHPAFADELTNFLAASFLRRSLVIDSPG